MTTAEAAMAVVSFSEQLKHARELVSEGHRLLHVANRDLNAGNVLVRRTHKNLAETEGFLRRNNHLKKIAN